MRRPTRNFDAGDAAILAGSTALAGSMFPLIYLSGRMHGWYTYLVPTAPAMLRLGWIYPIAAIPILMASGPAILSITLRGPRPPLRRLMRRPGATASFAASLALLVPAFILVAGMIRGKGVYEDWLESTSPPIGLAVAGVWTVGAITGRWRPGSGWVDRLGRAMGWIWIATSLLLLWAQAIATD